MMDASRYPLLFSFSSNSSQNSEKGSVLVLFSVFMLMMIPLLALSIDSYFMVEGRLEERE